MVQIKSFALAAFAWLAAAGPVSSLTTTISATNPSASTESIPGVPENIWQSCKAELETQKVHIAKPVGNNGKLNQSYSGSEK